MNSIAARVVALNSFARKGDYVNESWATRQFPKTYAAAVAACKDSIDSTMGVNIHWSASRPDALVIEKRSIVSERTEFSRELPLAGEIGAALISDLKALAITEAAARIQVERDQALIEEAGERVEAIIQAPPELTGQLTLA